MRLFSFLVIARVDASWTAGRIAVRLEGMEKGIDRDAAHYVARPCHIVSLYTRMQCWALLVRAFLLCCPADQGAGVDCEA